MATAAPFKNEVHDLEAFLATHLDVIAPGMRLIAQQLDTGAGDRLDILAAVPSPTGEHQVAIIELKNVRADANVLLQSWMLAISRSMS